MRRKPAVCSLLEGRSTRAVLEENRISKRQPCPNLHGSQFGRLLVADFLGFSAALVIDKKPPCPASLLHFDTHPRVLRINVVVHCTRSIFSLAPRARAIR